MAAQSKSRMTRRGTIVLSCVLVVVFGVIADAAVLALTADQVRGLIASRDVVGSRGPVCTPVIDEPVRDRGHRPQGTYIEYPTSPPASGPHYPTPADPGTRFYTSGNSPKVETLVHNLEHGYTVVWYDSAVQGGQLNDLGKIASTLGRNPGKVIVAAWDTGHGRFPKGRHVAMSHWGATQGHLQYCRGVVPATIGAFVKRFPRTDAPEPNAR